MGDAGDLCVLLTDPLHRVNDQHDNIRPFYGADSPHNHIVLQFFLYLVFSAESCRVDEDIFLSVMDDFRIHGIPGGARNVRNDQPFLPQKLIDQHDGYSGAVVLFLVRRIRPEMRDHLLQHVPQSHLIYR